MYHRPVRSSPTEQLIVRGSRLEVAWAGPARGASRAVIALLHEGLGSVSHWREIPARIAAATGMTVMAYSRLGYGQSDPASIPRPVTYLHDEAAVLPDVLAAAGLNDRPLILLGHSDGASIAIIHAADARPKTLLGLILEAPHVFVEDLSVESIARAKTSFETTDLRERLAKYHAHVDSAFWGWNGVWLNPEFRRFNIEARLDRLELPLLVIQGRDDQYGTLAQVQAIVTKSRGLVETMILPGAGHAPHRDQPDRVIARVRDFVATLLDRPPAIRS